MAPISLPGQIARTRRFALGVPGQFTITADGTAVLFLRSRAGDDPVSCLWALDAASGTERLLADPVALTGPARALPDGGCGQPAATPWQGAGIEAYAVSAQARLVAFTVAGGLWAADAVTGGPRQLPARGLVTDPRPDPAGQRIAYLSGGALRMIEADGTGDRVIAAPGGADVAFGTAPHTGGTSPDGACGYWWAPDGSQMLAARSDSAGVELWHLPDPAEPGTPPPTVRYAAAGKANPEVTLWIARLNGGLVQVRWERAWAEYVIAAGWDAHGPYALVNSRDQQTARLLGIDPASGATVLLAQQHDKCWVQPVPGLPARTGSGALLAHADLAGTRYLTVNGAAVTPPGLQLRAVLGVEGEQVLFTASTEPAETHLWTYRPGEDIRQLSAGVGVHSGVRRGGTLVQVARGADQPGGHFTVLRMGRPAVPIASLAARPVLDDQVTAVQEAARLHPDLDAGRVGIRGWSFGGSLAALAVLRRPDVFHAAVAGAGVTDQLLYNAHWRERFLGHPAEFPGRYEACSLVREAPKLTRPLLLIHGLADDNVFAANTLRLSSALLAAGRQHEVLLLPGAGHRAIGGPLTEELLRHQVRFLQRHLGAHPQARQSPPQRQDPRSPRS